MDAMESLIEQWQHLFNLQRIEQAAIRALLKAANAKLDEHAHQLDAAQGYLNELREICLRTRVQCDQNEARIETILERLNEGEEWRQGPPDGD